MEGGVPHCHNMQEIDVVLRSSHYGHAQAKRLKDLITELMSGVLRHALPNQDPTEMGRSLVS